MKVIASTPGAIGVAVALVLGGCGGSAPSAPSGGRGAHAAQVRARGGKATRGAGGASGDSAGAAALSTGVAPAGHRSRAARAALARGKASRHSPNGAGNALGSGASGGGANGAGGGSSVGGSGHAHAPSSFILAGDAVCREYRREVASLGSNPSFASQEEVEPTLIGDVERALARLRAISAPGAYAALYSRFIDQTQSSVNEFKAAQTQSRSNLESQENSTEQQDYNAYEASAQDAQNADAAARAIGFHVCGSAGSDWL
jgi:hypothetical protein